MKGDQEFRIIDGVAMLNEPRIIYCGRIFLSARDGYCWNGANIPRWLQWLFGTPFDSIHAIPSLDHDRIYEEGHWLGIKRSAADRKYREDIIMRGQHPALAWLEWANVRMFGWMYWQYC